jgi:hypothetical protein
MTLRKAFDGSSLPALVLNIVRGEYPEPPRELFTPEAGLYKLNSVVTHTYILVPGMFNVLFGVRTRKFNSYSLG